MDARPVVPYRTAAEAAALFFHALQQERNGLLEVYPVPAVILLGKGKADALHRIIGGKSQRLGNGHAAQNRSDCGGGVDIPRSMEAYRKMLFCYYTAAGKGNQARISV